MIKSSRFTKVGIQRELHIEWFDEAVQLYVSGVKKNELRPRIYTYLDHALGFDTPPSLQTKTYVANVLIKSWINPDSDLIPLRNAAFHLLSEKPEMRFPLHWCLLGAAYPFWFSVAAVIGRLLNLQSQVTQTQVVNRLKEKFGDRQTISRRARYVIRSFVAWGVLKDVETQGCYEKVAPIEICDSNLSILMFESALLAMPEAKGTLGLLLNNPAFFPFQMPTITDDFVSKHGNRFEVIYSGMDGMLFGLKSYK